MRTQYYPIGTTVLLEGANKRLMIYGIMQTCKNDGRKFDYIACLYPEGYLNREHTYLFNHEDIVQVDFMGFVDAEQEKLRRSIIRFCEEERKR